MSGQRRIYRLQMRPNHRIRFWVVLVDDTRNVARWADDTLRLAEMLIEQCAPRLNLQIPMIASLGNALVTSGNGWTATVAPRAILKMELRTSGDEVMNSHVVREP